MYLAAALHYKYGFPINVSVAKEPCGPRTVSKCNHAWVVLPSGECLDITGIHKAKDIESATGGDKIRRNFQIKRLEYITECSLDRNNKEVKQALNDFLSLGLNLDLMYETPL